MKNANPRVGRSQLRSWLKIGSKVRVEWGSGKKTAIVVQKNKAEVVLHIPTSAGYIEVRRHPNRIYPLV